MNEKLNQPKESAELADEQLDTVAGGFNPFSREGICKGCGKELGDIYHVVTEMGIKFYLCSDCYEKYKTGELSLTVTMEPRA
jgi:predicted peroxiredoxin